MANQQVILTINDNELTFDLEEGTPATIERVADKLNVNINGFQLATITRGGVVADATPTTLVEAGTEVIVSQGSKNA